MDYLREARIRFREVQPLAPWLQAVFLIGAIGMAAAVYPAMHDPKLVGPAKALPLVGPAALVVCWLWLRQMEIVLDDQNLSFGFWLFRPSVPLKNIVSCELEKITLWKYGGIGIRVAAGAVCYNTRFGDGVRIRVEGRRRDWVFSCDDTPRLLALLNEDIARRGTPHPV